MQESKVDRRAFLRSAVTLGAAAGAASLLAACGKGGGALVCTDVAGLAPAEAATRTSLQYVEASADPTKLCSGCVLYVAGQPNACGGCQVVKGPINPGGYCASWAKKV
jgi:hypothetical protein